MAAKAKIEVGKKSAYLPTVAFKTLHIHVSGR